MFWNILKEQPFFYILLKVGSIKRIIGSSGFCYLSGLMFVAIIACVLLFPCNLDYLANFEP